MNKLSYFVLGALSLIILLSLNTGCKKDPAVSEFVIATDSVVHADTISSGDQFNIEFYGKVGDNNCYEFLKIDPAFGADFIEISLIGQFTDRNDCSGNPVYMNPVAAGFTDMTPGLWTIKVLQPDGKPTQESTVFVE